MAGGIENKNFFAALFDFSFTSFVTLKFIKVIYVVLVSLILLGGVVFLIAGLSGGGGRAVAALVVIPLVTLLYLIFARIYMELIALFFRIAENTSVIARSVGGSGTTGWGEGFSGSSLGGPTTPAPPSA